MSIFWQVFFTAVLYVQSVLLDLLDQTLSTAMRVTSFFPFGNNFSNKKTSSRKKVLHPSALLRRVSRGAYLPVPAIRAIRAMDLKINEKAAIAQKQFMDKCAKLVEGVKLGFWPRK